MEINILSLKTIYKLLSSKDYPVYSTGIFKMQSIKGYTLLKFWQEILSYHFREDYYGKQIWRTEGGRNRFLSDICNRSERIKFYPQYAQEFSAKLNTDVFMEQVELFKNLLYKKQYDKDVFEKKIDEYLVQISKEDELSREVCTFLLSSMDEYNKSDIYTEQNEDIILSKDAWILTMLTIHALAGLSMNSSVINSIREQKCYSLLSCIKESGATKKNINQVRILTHGNNKIEASSLSRAHFFGREADIFELREKLNTKQKYLISGIGGIGKTELLRHFLNVCIEEALVTNVVLLQYHESLTETLLEAFPQFTGNRENKLQQIKNLLFEICNEDTLILIDNLDESIHQDTLFPTLQSMDVSVFATSRMSYLDGFISHPLSALSKSASMLVFRDHYPTPLSKSELSVLSDILDEDLFNHTLSILRLAKLAKQHDYSVEQIHSLIGKTANDNISEESTMDSKLHRLYKNIYLTNDLPENLKETLFIFSRFPYNSYDAGFLKHLLNYESEASCIDDLQKLYKLGWLEWSIKQDTYAMHPVIAESLSTQDVSETPLKAFFHNVYRWWQELGGFQAENILLGSTETKKEEMHAIASIICYISNHLVPGFSEETFELLFQVHAFQHFYHGLTIHARFLHLKDEHLPTNETQLYGYLALKMYFYQGDLELCYKLFVKQLDELTISKERFLFYSGIFLHETFRLAEYERFYEIFGILSQLPLPIVAKQNLYYEAICVDLLTQNYPLFEEHYSIFLGLLEEKTDNYYNETHRFTLRLNILKTFRRPKEVIALAEEMLERDTTSYQAYGLEALLSYYIGCLIQVKDWDKVSQYFNNYQLLRSITDNDQLDIFTVQIPYYKGEYDEAIRTANNMLDIINGTNIASKNAIYYRFRIYSLIGDSHLACKRWKKAIDAYEQVLKLLEKTSLPYVLSRSETKVMLAKCYHAIGDTKKEEELLNEALPQYNSILEYYKNFPV